MISDLNDLSYFLSEKKFQNVPLCLKFNTGMNRIGLLQKDLDQIISLLKSHNRQEVFHLMSHFANASLEIKEKSMTSRQYEEFSSIKNQLISSGISISRSSIANSGAIEQGYIFESESHVRPGILAYGASSLIPPLREKFPWKGKLVSSFKTKILRTFDLSKGDPVGYGAMVVPENCTILVLPIGYGDGFSRGLVKGKINLGGKIGTFFGRVSMDMMTVMFSREDGLSFQEHDLVSLWSDDPLEITALADHLNTISYEILCQIGERIPREYLS